MGSSLANAFAQCERLDLSGPLVGVNRGGASAELQVLLTEMLFPRLRHM